MPKSFNSREIITVLKRHGFLLKRSKGSHFVFYNPQTKLRVVIPVHPKDLPKGTLHEILKQAGITEDDLLS